LVIVGVVVSLVGLIGFSFPGLPWITVVPALLFIVAGFL
jgi:hypothetical protein